MGFTEKNIYEAIKKEYNDRYLEVYVEHINKNGKEGSTVPLTDEEVRNDEEDQHQATDLHLTVNSITGKVINDIFEG